MNLMKKISHFFIGALLAIAMLAAAFTAPSAVAATQNYSTAIPGVVVIPFHISGQYTATTANVVKFNIPFKARLIGVGATARASGGTTPTLTVDLKVATVSALSAPISITALTYSEGTIANAVVADEAAVTVDLTIGGTSPTWNDITVFVTVLRE